MISKTILVAGGGGFIGSHLCKQLIDKNHTVVCLDNFVTSHKRNIQSLQKFKNFILHQSDTRTILQDLKLQKFKFDEIYDLASPASVQYIMDYPTQAATANSIGTYNLLEIAKKDKAIFLFASSSESYGDPKEHPQKESYWGNVNPVGLRSGYDEGKRFGEALCMAYHRELGVSVKIVRIFNTYGPHASPKDTRVIPQFVSNALQNKPLKVHGKGDQTRSFCYVSDLVFGLTKMMESSVVGPVNLGNPIEYKIIDVAKKIIKKTGSKSKITFVKRPPDDPSQRKPDITLAKEKLNWQPRVTFEEGIQKTIEYFKEII